MEIAKDWIDYEIIDMAQGEKVERWKDIILIRPDPQIIWNDKSFPEKWKRFNGRYIRSSSGGGHWECKKVPEVWQVKYKELIFNIRTMGFKHTGLFPEQAVNWDWMINKIKQSKRKELNILNLFAYTGGATVACSYAGANVVHVDSSKGMVSWAKENIISSGLENNKVRFIVDDVTKFVQREIRRGNKYDAIIMDPPSYGRGKNGEVWQFENQIYDLVGLCKQVLNDKPLFFLINSYTTGISCKVLEDILYLNLKNRRGKFSSGEIGLPMTNSSLCLPCGIYGRWEC